MNNQNPGMYMPFLQNNFALGEELKSINMEISKINSELKRLERRIINIEKGLVPIPPNPINPNPLARANQSYTTENYMI